MTRDICSQLKWWAENCDRCNGGCQVRGLLKDAAQEISALRAQQIDENNAPLTLDELREMDGEPVWVVLLERTTGNYSGWAIVYRNNGYAAVQRWTSWTLWYEDYGKTWLAYRRKPEESTR